MNKIAWSAIALLFGLWGCATERSPTEGSPFQASWYFVVKDSDNPQMYLAVLNQSLEDKKIDGVILNPSKDRPDTGWRQNNWNPPYNLKVGEILLIKVDKDVKDHPEILPSDCIVPVEVVVLQQSERVRAKMNVAMPSSVPEGWEDQCKK